METARWTVAVGIMAGILRPILIGTVVAGTLDLLAMFLLAWATRLRPPGDVLRRVATGPFGDIMREAGPFAALAGFVVHYAMIAGMMAAFVVVTRAVPSLLRHPVPVGLVYGTLIYFIMHWMVLPFRWPTEFPISRPLDIVLALILHTSLVGVPMALIAAYFRPRGET
jgi:hypothetical protein